MIYRILAAAALALGGCISTAPHASPELLAAARPMHPDVTEEALEIDRSLWVETCRGCHVLPTGHRAPVEEWPELVRKMEAEVAMEPDVAARIVRYLQASRLYWEAETRRRAEEAEARRKRAGNASEATGTEG